MRETKHNTDICSCIIVKVTEIVSSILFQLIVLKGMHQLQLVSLSNRK